MLKSLAAAVAVAFATGAAAQSFPTKPIALMVPFAAGGPTDTVARSLAQGMGKNLGQTVVVENVPGAGGTIAPTKLKGANNDGYTLMLAHIGMSTAPALYRKLPFSPLNDFEHIGQVVDVPMMFVAKKDMPATDFKSLVDYVKKNKDKVTLANAGVGAASHLCGLLFMSAIQTELTTVPYKGTAPAMNDLLGGQVDMMCDQTTNTTKQIQGGTIKAYAVTSAERLDVLPDVPTAEEAGLPGFQVGIWHGLYAPKGTPAAVTQRLSQALQVALRDPRLVSRFAELGTTPVAQERATPEAHRQFWMADIAKWKPIIQAAGQYAD